MDPNLKRRRGVLAALCMALLLSVFPSSAAAVQKGTNGPQNTVVGYYAGWASSYGYNPEHIPAQLLTHINYAFAGIDPEGNRLVLTSPDRDRENLAGLRRLRSRYPHLKIQISVGGWDGSAHFSDIASTAARREAFAESCASLVSEQQLDGVDLDWEYPVSGGAAGTVHRSRDRENFTLLLQAIRASLDRQGRKDGKTYGLTIAGAAGSGYLSCIQPSQVAQIVDHIFLMAYDLHGPWDTYSDFNAPLYTPDSPAPQYQTSVADSVQGYLDRGVPGEKLVLGIPLYGYCYQEVRGGINGLHAAFSSARSLSYDTVVRDYLSSGAYRSLRHSKAQAPYLYGGGIFLTYEDPESAAAKGTLAQEMGLAGVGFWELSQDSGGVLVKSACGAFSSGIFADVPKTGWYHSAVEFVQERGWMSGTASNTFSPDLAVSRGMFAVILYQMEGSPAAGSRNQFSDVKPEDYFARAVTWAVQKGLVSGYDSEHFGPYDSLTREQLAVILCRYAKKRGFRTSQRTRLDGFQDAGAVSQYARDSISWAVAAGLLSGRTGTTLAPSGTATRAETAAILMAFSKLAR